MTGKSIIAIAFVLAIAFAVTSGNSLTYGENYGVVKANKSNHLIVGNRLPGDRLLLKQNVTKKSGWLQVVEVKQTFYLTRYEKITQLRALDQKTNGNGATASLLQGGPGANNVTLYFRSQRGHGINFVVELYARPY